MVDTDNQTTIVTENSYNEKLLINFTDFMPKIWPERKREIMMKTVLVTP